ncbi:MAG: excinuclease ABC subunit UvrC [Clostridia bacterium]|nr:excinuclease ABC subunit UvrC [Clostridia bacterium]
MNSKLSQLRSKAMKLPLTPGVYIMKNSHGEIIYIGKAKALKNRVSQYFGSQTSHSVKVRKMVENVDDFDYILVDSEFEALVLECSLIKQNMPKYNILLKDDKGYSYVKITPGEWGRIEACFRKDDEDAEYLGPFTGNYSIFKAVDEAVKIYKLPTCGRVFPRDIGKSRPCLNYHIGICCGVCTGKVNNAEYRQTLKEAVEFISGDSSQTVKALTKKMEQAAENLDFETAAKLRDRINAINRSVNKQKVVSDTVKNQDVFAIAQGPDNACLAVLRFKDGRLYDSQSFILGDSECDDAARHDLIAGFYTMDREIPPKICCDGEVSDSELLCRWLSEKAGRKVSIYVPQRGEQVGIMQLCRQNALEKLSQHTGRRDRRQKAADELAVLLGLKTPPEYIESYDISHTAGSDNVAGMVVFRNGVPYKSAYRKFSIKGFDGQDDCGSMREVISRRLNRYEEHKDSGEGFGRLPDLILLDGGLPQVNAVRPIIEAFGFDIPVFGMVKDDRHRTRAITADGGEIAITDKRQAFTLVSDIQEEVHRFAVSYHHKKHAASSINSTLTQIPGIGEKKAAVLIRHFKTLDALKKAGYDELCAVSGISKANAEEIKAYFANTSREK